MNDDTILLRTIWRCCALAVCTLVATIGGCTMHENYLIAQASERRVNAIQAGCAIAPSNMTDGVCAFVAADKGVTI